MMNKIYKYFNKKSEENAITLIALVVTIVILLLLSGVTIITIIGNNGLLIRATQSKKIQIESEMKEQLGLAIQNLQIEKKGEATLDDITQQWVDKELKYECKVEQDILGNSKKVVMEKNGVIGKFVIDENLNITEVKQDESSAKLKYEIVSKDEENIKILLTIIDKENGLKQVEFSDGSIIYCDGKEEVTKDYEVKLGVEYTVKIISRNDIKKEEKILINGLILTSGTDITLTSGEYLISESTNVDNTMITIPENEEVVLTIEKDVTINNKNFEKSAIDLQGNAVLTLYSNAELNLYSGFAQNGAAVIPGSNGRGGTGGYAGIHVPENATLNLCGTNAIYAYGGDAGDGGDTMPSNYNFNGGGGGGAGAGIGGNGGNGSEGDQFKSLDGESGENAGTINIYTTVYAYGGSGGSGGRTYEDGGGGRRIPRSRYRGWRRRRSWWS